MRALALALTVAFIASCSFAFSRPAPNSNLECRPNGWLAIGDIVVATGTGVTAGVAVYPCVGDVEQRDKVRAIHCGVVAVGVGLAVATALSARRGLRNRKKCSESMSRRQALPSR